VVFPPEVPNQDHTVCRQEVRETAVRVPDLTVHHPDHPAVHITEVPREQGVVVLTGLQEQGAVVRHHPEAVIQAPGAAVLLQGREAVVVALQDHHHLLHADVNNIYQ
jgi:hypothetical protein